MENVFILYSYNCKIIQVVQYNTYAATEQVGRHAEEFADHVLVHIEVVCARSHQHRQRTYT